MELLEYRSTESKLDVSSSGYIVGSRLGEVAAFTGHILDKVLHRSRGKGRAVLSPMQGLQGASCNWEEGNSGIFFAPPSHFTGEMYCLTMYDTPLTTLHIVLQHPV